MRKTLPCLAATVLALSAPARAETPDLIGDMIGKVIAGAQPLLDTFGLKATLYLTTRHSSGKDSIGCRVIPMRTVAVDGEEITRHTVLFIKETVGMPMPDGRPHDGYWYATDVGSKITKGRIDLYTGKGWGSLQRLMPLNLSTLTVTRVGQFTGCPTSDGSALLPHQRPGMILPSPDAKPALPAETTASNTVTDPKAATKTAAS